MRSRGEVVAESDDRGGTRLRVLRSSGALQLRPTPGGVYLVGGAAGPVGGDEFSLRVVVGPGATLTIRSAAASVVHPGPGDAESTVEIDVEVGDGASLVWQPEPTIALVGCRHRASTAISVGVGGSLEWHDDLVLGRFPEPAGDLTTRLDLVVDGRVAIRSEQTYRGLRRVRSVTAVGGAVRPGPRFEGPLSARLDVAPGVTQDLSVVPSSAASRPATP